MAAITTITTANQRFKLLETIAIVNQTANSTAVSKAVAVPAWARYATFVVDVTNMDGTSPLFDFTVKGANVADTNPPDDADVFLLGAGWDGITQLTAEAPIITIHIGPDIPTDDTGSATADCAYGVSAPLPEYLVYTYTTDGTTDDEDYNATISIYFRA